MATTFDLPMPPSTNNLFRNVRRGRVRTARYEDWRTAAGWRLKQQAPAPVAGLVWVDIEVARVKGRADLDNRIKAVLDLLVVHGVIEDDSKIEEIAIRWSDVISGALVTVGTWA